MWKKLLFAVSMLAGMLVVGFIGYMVIIFAGNYVIDKEDLVMDSATTLVNEEGDTLSKLYVENRHLIDIKNIPEDVQEAFISVEDSRFYEHHGIDIQGIMRALYTDITSGSKAEGGSTITQQLAKRVFLSNDKTLLRKAKEAVIALNLERRYSKKQILEMYLNQVYFGHGAYGIQSAAKIYFNKPAKDLTAAEGAVLAAIPKAPATYSPVDHPKKAKKRRNLVLSLMADQGYITAQQAVQSKNKTLATDFHKMKKHPAYWTYIDMVLQEAEEKYHLTNEAVLKGGYKIVVPMNRKAQKASYQMFQNPSYFSGSDKDNPPQGAFVLMDPQNGGVLAVQGGRDYVRKGINRVNVKRQPGSAFKPLAVYGPALDTNQFAPYSMLKDKKQVYEAYDNYEPENYSHHYRGEMTMYDALRVSANAPAVWLLNKIGIDTSRSYLQKANINISDQGLSMALGGLKKGVSPLKMATAYRAFAAGGKVVEPHFISKIYDRYGKLIGKADAQEKKVYSPQTAWYMTKMLRSVVKDGTAEEGDVDTALAGKTGTTSFPKVNGANRDAWFVGYTPKAVGAVWMGYDKTTKHQYLTASSHAPTSLFKDLLKKMPNQQNLAFTKPKGVDDLETPIRMAHVNDVKADFTLNAFGIPSVKLNWTPASDDRLIYHIYAIKNGDKKQIGKVTGKGSYMDKGVNPLSLPSYVVIPYNPQTDKEGKSSDTAQTHVLPKFLSRSSDDKSSAAP